MDDKARAARNAYKREWYRRNKDKVRQYAERHWQKVAEAETAAAPTTEKQAQQPAE